MAYLQVNNSDQKAWGKLTSINQNLENVNLSSSAYKIGRNSTNDIAIQDVRISGNHCILTRSENGTVNIQDLSSNGTFVEDQKIGKGKSKLLMPGNRFYLLPPTKIAEKDLLGYIFSLAGPDNNNDLKRKRDNEESVVPNNKLLKPPGSPIEEEVKEFKCSLCHKYLHQCLTTIPCQHNFCGSCYSTIVGTVPECPECQSKLTELRRNDALDEKVKKFLERVPRHQRSPEELRLMNQQNKYPHGCVFPRETEAPKPQQQLQQQQQQQQQQKPRQEPQSNQRTNAPPATNDNRTANTVRQNAPVIAAVRKEQKPLTKIERYHMLMSKFTAE